MNIKWLHLCYTFILIQFDRNNGNMLLSKLIKCVSLWMQTEVTPLVLSTRSFLIKFKIITSNVLYHMQI